jgi:hypothetical protein
MNFNQRLDAIEPALKASTVMSIAATAHWFWLMIQECTEGERVLGERGGYLVPGSVPLFSTNITPEDWKWYEANRERYLEAVEFYEKLRK